jgi:hypothetical protein
MRQLVKVSGLSNQEFLQRHAAAGRIGLSGGTTLIDKAICRAERHLDEQGRWGVWSHAFVFQGERLDGHHWVLESDLQLDRKHLRLGVQENRISKYFDESMHSSLAVLDLGLSEAQVRQLVCAGLDMVANRERYSITELFGTLLSLKHTSLRGRENLLARERSVFCSAFVRHVFLQAKVDLVPGVELKNTTPEDIARIRLPHTAYVLQREVARSTLRQLGRRVKVGVKTRLRELKRNPV